jgi:hypothetical protein
MGLSLVTVASKRDTQEQGSANWNYRAVDLKFMSSSWSADKMQHCLHTRHRHCVHPWPWDHHERCEEEEEGEKMQARAPLRMLPPSTPPVDNAGVSKSQIL